MRFSTAAYFLGLLTAVSAHFQLQFPAPRGPFVEDDEPTFCDNYGNAVDNRTQFPLSGGFFSLNSEHPLWTLGVMISTVQNPDNFANFTTSGGQQQLAVQYFEATDEGLFCLPINLAATGISGVQNGANVTLQFVFDGGDGQLYQCADLTLSNDASIPAGTACSNASNPEVSFFSSGVVPTSFSPSSTGSSSAPSSSTSTGAGTRNVAGLTGLLGVVGAVFALL
ncbi:hypothetical protein B0H21DRAFT_737384 [Amylocystis lapponica]|nr:hypothetical protein B0H21DRAFT_737384 [Amylocystis lapponica]